MARRDPRTRECQRLFPGSFWSKEPVDNAHCKPFSGGGYCCIPLRLAVVRHSKCPICLESTTNRRRPVTVARCGHVFHTNEYEHLFKDDTFTSCPMCRCVLVRDVCVNADTIDDLLQEYNDWAYMSCVPDDRVVSDVVSLVQESGAKTITCEDLGMTFPDTILALRSIGVEMNLQHALLKALRAQDSLVVHCLLDLGIEPDFSGWARRWPSTSMDRWSPDDVKQLLQRELINPTVLAKIESDTGDGSRRTQKCLENFARLCRKALRDNGIRPLPRHTVNAQ